MRIRLVVLTCLTALVLVDRGAAEIIVHQGLAENPANFIPGQSLTTPSRGPWDNLKFNWYSETDGTLAFTPTAFGTLFLLSEEYLGLAQNLSSGLPGFIAQSQSIAGDQYIFDPVVTIQPNTQYFFYANASGVNVGAYNPYAGGNIYVAEGNNIPFNPTPGDAAFRLEGNAVPEPGSMVIALTGIVFAGVVWRRRTNASRRCVQVRL